MLDDSFRTKIFDAEQSLAALKDAVHARKADLLGHERSILFAADQMLETARGLVSQAVEQVHRSVDVRLGTELTAPRTRLLRSCPACHSEEQISTERRPNGNSRCGQCGHSGPTSTFDSQVPA